MIFVDSHVHCTTEPEYFIVLPSSENRPTIDIFRLDIVIVSSQTIYFDKVPTLWLFWIFIGKWGFLLIFIIGPDATCSIYVFFTLLVMHLWMYDTLYGKTVVGPLLSFRASTSSSCPGSPDAAGSLCRPLFLFRIGQSMLASIESFTDLVSLISDIWLFCIYNVYIIVIRCRC